MLTYSVTTSLKLYCSINY